MIKNWGKYAENFLTGIESNLEKAQNSVTSGIKNTFKQKQPPPSPSPEDTEETMNPENEENEKEIENKKELGGLRKSASQFLNLLKGGRPKNENTIPTKWINPSQLIWDDSQLEDIFSEEILEDRYDYEFQKSVKFFGRPRTMQEPNIEFIMEFAKMSEDMCLITQATNMQKEVVDQRREISQKIFREKILPKLTKKLNILEVHNYIFEDQTKVVIDKELQKRLQKRLRQLQGHQKSLKQEFTEFIFLNLNQISEGLNIFKSIEIEGNEKLEGISIIRAALDERKKSTKMIIENVCQKKKKIENLKKIKSILKEISSEFQDKIRRLVDINFGIEPLDQYADIYQQLLEFLIALEAKQSKLGGFHFFESLISKIEKNLETIKLVLKQRFQMEIGLAAMSSDIVTTQNLKVVLSQYKKISKIAQQFSENEKIDTSSLEFLAMDENLIWIDLVHAVDGNDELTTDEASNCMRELVINEWNN